MDKKLLSKFVLAEDVRKTLESVKSIIIPQDREQMLDLTFKGEKDTFEVGYDVPGKGFYVEATVDRCKNGASVNYTDAYMRRRDPAAMVIADSQPTDKAKYTDRFGETFDNTRTQALEWLAGQDELIVLPFMSGDAEGNYPSVLVAPANAGFFVTGLADLQGFIPRSELPDNFEPVGALFLVPPFRHTHFEGKQVVVHNRTPKVHELFCFNLYPGPSAKKGVYSILIHEGEKENWVTLHSSAVRLITPYDNEFVILHEGASGGGKSELTQAIHREDDGRILVARDTIHKENIYLEMLDTCELHPVTDDMALADMASSPSGKLVVQDAEEGWFLRVDHHTEYGTEPSLERLCTHPPEPLIFINIDGKPGATALLWEHTLDEPGKPCPNPRVIMPRKHIPNVVTGKVEVDVRSFGVRTPPTTKDSPNYGIIGMLHILPPALAWLWRLVAPRGHANPSIIATKGLTSEGVGSYWPFATGKMITQANLLLDLALNTPMTRYVLIPNQYIGAFHVGFKPEWIGREYIARRGSVKFRPEQLITSRCPLLGYSLPSLKVNGQEMPHGLLQVEEQPDVGIEGYDKGAKILNDFFLQELAKFDTPDLHPLGRQIIELVKQGAPASSYEELMPSGVSKT
ncbi:DUF4914 family protein [Spirochaeta dissipatitropha]